MVAVTTPAIRSTMLPPEKNEDKTVDITALIPFDTIECDAGCGNLAPTIKCARCRCVYYCNKNCQVGHWKQHKETCVDFQKLASAKLQPQQPLKRVPSGEGMQCGICRKVGDVDSGDLPIVFSDCNHAFCLVCLKTKLYQQFHESMKEDTYDDKDSCHCPTCNKTMLPVNASNVEDIPCIIANHYVDVAERMDTDEATKLDLMRAAMVELKKVVRGYALSSVTHVNTDAGAANSVWTAVSREKAFAAEMRMAELQLQFDPAMALKAIEAVQKDEAELQMLALRHTVAEFTPDDDPAEKDGVTRLLRSTCDNGLAFQAWVAAHESKVAHRIFRMTMTKGRAYETMEDWEAAQKEYQSLQSIDVGDGNPCKFTNEQKALLLSRLADCATTRGDLDKALSLYTRSRSIDRRAPGIHRKIASVYQSQGDVELAQAAVSVALAHEAPWDGENTTKNADMYFELSTENLAQQERRKQEEAFYNVWGEVLTLFESFCTTEDQAISWSLMKEKEYDMVAEVSDDESETSLDEHDTARKVQAAQEAALLAETDASETEVSDILSDNLQEVARDMQSPAFSVSDDADVVDGKQYDCIKLTKEALKNVKKLDEKYKEFFTRRVEDLASGRRSRIMAKGLKGCKNVRIFETYLEQKSGFRILWTADDKNGLVIWYVVEHKKVSKYMKMIDEADERASRRLTSASSLSEDTPTLLDPRSDTPLKVYDIPRDQIKKLESDNWKPRLHLTKEEKSIVETDGTVLLLGRSGTGKTVCICERIARDRHHAEVGKQFSQLFVARSRGICKIVSSLVGSEYDENDQHLRNVEYITFTKLINKCNETLQQADDPLPFDPAYRVDFRRFKREFPWVCKCDVDALVIWTQIRSFIKGSIEALVKGRPKYLGLQEYLDMEVFSVARCRLSKLQREKAYEAFLRYENEKRRNNLWDDCDRISALHTGLETATRELGSIPAGLLFDRVYVDEVQDYTQQEIALFFKLCKPGQLFLAGDPAQAVVEGVEFRFQEIRSAVYKLLPDSIQADMTKRQRYVPERPRKVTVNFRSHSGILNVAGSVLNVLFDAFPNSAPDLGVDRGVFLGPRPGLFENVTEQRLKELVAKIDGVYLLTRTEEDVERLKGIVGSKQFVLSIRDSKGLEFSDVILVDFFKGLSAENQIPWRELLKNLSNKGDISEFQNKYPEIETHLKHLYTAITRCKMRFFIAETAESVAGTAFFKWISKLDLASRQRVDDVEKMVKTRDQWITTGMEHAAHGESMDEFKEAQAWLGRAAVCFENAEDPDLQRKVEVNLQSILFREELYNKEVNSDDDESKADCERRAVPLMAQLVKEGLLTEVSKLCHDVIPLLGEYAQKSLQQRLVPMLPASDD